MNRPGVREAPRRLKYALSPLLRFAKASEDKPGRGLPAEALAKAGAGVRGEATVRVFVNASARAGSSTRSPPSFALPSFGGQVREKPARRSLGGGGGKLQSGSSKPFLPAWEVKPGRVFALKHLAAGREVSQNPFPPLSATIL